MVKHDNADGFRGTSKWREIWKIRVLWIVNRWKHIFEKYVGIVHFWLIVHKKHRRIRVRFWEVGSHASISDVTMLSLVYDDGSNGRCNFFCEPMALGRGGADSMAATKLIVSIHSWHSRLSLSSTHRLRCIGRHATTVPKHVWLSLSPIHTLRCIGRHAIIVPKHVWLSLSPIHTLRCNNSP